MIKKSIVGLVVCLSLLAASNTWAQTTYVPDTGDPNERVCNPKSYTDLGNGIVRDNVTGLEWVQDGNLIASRDPSFDNDGMVTWQHALDYVDLLNDEEYLGYDDWRLPTIEELSTLVDAGRYNPAIDPVFKTVAFDYWSSTTDAHSTDIAWDVGFVDGVVSTSGKTSYSYVRAVRGGQSGALDTFVINGDGTVTDTNTDLMWQQCNYGQSWSPPECTGDVATRSWDQALAYVQELNTTHYLGYEDWRLPTRNELQSIVNYSIYFPATTFPNTVVSDYWSSTISAYASDNAWGVHFYSGYVGYYGKDIYGYVRAVRGGVCVHQCELIVTHKQISAEKLTKPRKVVLNVTSADETFDIFGRIDLGPLTWEKVQFNRKKNQLKIHAIVPAGLEPGVIPISVGDCFGEVVITGTDR